MLFTAFSKSLSSSLCRVSRAAWKLKAIQGEIEHLKKQIQGCRMNLTKPRRTSTMLGHSVPILRGDGFNELSQR
jgi:ABC-type dipeptide/oligopeptide/nickel transport system ATPase component